MQRFFRSEFVSFCRAELGSGGVGGGGSYPGTTTGVGVS